MKRHEEEGLDLLEDTVRLFRRGDFARICALEEGENGAPYPAAVFIRQASELYPQTFFVSESGSALSGYAIGAVSAENTTDAWILRLKVAPNFRRKRIGSALLQALVAALEEKGVRSIRLSVSPENTPALALYKKSGFVSIARETAYFGDGHDRFIMVLRV